MRASYRFAAFPLIATALLAGSSAAIAAPPSVENAGKPEAHPYPPPVSDSEDLSAVAFVGPHLLIASDETAEVWVVSKSAAATAKEPTFTRIALPVPNGGEIDIEAIATRGNTVFVAGSHSLVRKKSSSGKSQAKNRERMRSVKKAPNRDHIFRFQIDPKTGKLASEIESMSLREWLENDPLFLPFTRIPSKENGVDIEAIAAVDDWIYLGFRSPVLRHNVVPIVRTKFGDLSTAELFFVDLDGNGIRDMAATANGFLILAGPPGDDSGKFSVFHWTGQDGVPGKDRPDSVIAHLSHVPRPKGGKAEGMAIVNSDGNCFRLLVVFDGIAGGAPLEHEVCMPVRSTEARP